MNFRLYTQEEFYNSEDIRCAEANWPPPEVESAFKKYRTAIDQADHSTMASMLAEDGRGGNATFGLFDDSNTYLEFLKTAWSEQIPNHSVWHVIQGGRVVNKWRESLPGNSPSGRRYDYFGIAELIYSGEGKFRLMYSLPDVVGLRAIYSEWMSDKQHEVHGHIYPSLAE